MLTSSIATPSPHTHTSTAVDRVLPNISSYLRDVLRKENLSPEAEALRARYDTMFTNLEKFSSPELLPPPAVRSVTLRKSVGDSPGLTPVNRSRGKPLRCTKVHVCSDIRDSHVLLEPICL